MKTQIFKTVAVSALLGSHIFMFGQKAPDSEFKMDGNIQFMKLTEAGVLLVANGDGFTGIKPESNQLHFNFQDYGKVKQEEIEFVPNSPYVIIAQGGIFSSKKSVIDIVSGKKLFATEENGWKMLTQFNLMLPQNKLIIAGQRSSKEKFAMAVGIYDLATGKEEKIFNLQDPGKVSMSITTVTGKPLITGNKLLIPTSKATICLDLNTGNQLWEAKVDDISWLTADKTGKEIYAIEQKPNGNCNIFKLSDSGQVLWKEPHSVKGKISNFQILPNGLAVVSDVDNSGKSGLMKLASAASESRIAFLSSSTGEDLWEKAPKTKGYVQHFYVMDDGILFGIQEGGINKISFDGQTLFRKPLKTGENIHTMALVPKGMIYITDEDANIIDLKTGESIYGKAINYKKAKAVCSTYDKTGKRYLISTGEEIKSIDENSGDISSFATYKFDEKEAPTTMSAKDSGIFIGSSQNMMHFAHDGATKYQQYFRSPGKSTAGMILHGVLAVASTAVSASASYQAGMNRNSIGQYTSEGERYKAMGDAFAGVASASFAEMARRFKATSATENYQFILTKLNEGAGLAKVNKNTGEKEEEILLKDKKPTYEVDEFSGTLYYQANNNTIYKYNLMK